MKEHFDEKREILKWIAIGTMTIDHTGAVLYPSFLWLRLVGRLSFPLFSYLLVLGVDTTRNLRNYMLRLLLFAAISQVSFYLALGDDWLDPLNIFFTLSLGVLLLYSFKRANPLLALIPLLVSFVLDMDYGIYGIMTIGCTYLLTKAPKLGVFSLISLNLVFLFTEMPYQFLSLLALPLIFYHRSGTYLKEVNYKTVYPIWRKLFFYVYYPLHLTALFLIKISL